jgi:hypothetical protein
MPKYVRIKGKDTWHWCTNCDKYPTGSDLDISYTKPNDYELCNECKAKAKDGTCKT